jgi:hypothetical protein
MMPLPNSHLIGFGDEPGSHEPDGNRRPPAMLVAMGDRVDEAVEPRAQRSRPPNRWVILNHAWAERLSVRRDGGV